MSTNYYVAATRKCEDCQVEHMCCCGIHLGKSSGGNRFLFAYNGGKYYRTISELKKWLKNKRIIDEYGRSATLIRFANNAGGLDNITVALVSIEEEAAQ